MSSRHAFACDDCRSLLGGYVLSALEPEEMEAVSAHVRTCSECTRELVSLAPLPALLDVAGSAEPVAEKPPEALEDAVLDRFARERPRPLTTSQEHHRGRSTARR
ncbi:MAG TPA: zf-HC2 domain-containing protein, partial [Thermoleophilaceae bacterium]|nr:zf-HC2 domain-containing protein [Thermoleophilaceae bacterium]